MPDATLCFEDKKPGQKVIGDIYVVPSLECKEEDVVFELTNV
jgi:hypothetical protein